MSQTIYDYFYERYRRFPIVRIDSIQKAILPFITSPFFPWVCLIFLLNSKNWKRPAVFILIGHWFCRAVGDVLRNTMDLRSETAANAYWPYTKTNWYVSNGLAHFFWLLGEMMGDWYPLLRTKAVTNNDKKVKIVYITCICFNLTKVFGIYTYFMDMPIDLRITDENGNHVKDVIRFNIYWWSSIGMMQITSCIYDLSVIFSLKTCLFNKLNEYKNTNKNTFLEKFKQISELRIILSMIISIIFLPFLTFFIVSLIRQYHKSKVNSYSTVDTGIEQLRQVVLSFNFTLMYIDQVLLKSIVNKKKYVIRSKVSYTSSTLNKMSSIMNSLNSSNYYNSNNDIFNSTSVTQSESNNYDTLAMPSTSLISPSSQLKAIPFNSPNSYINSYTDSYMMDNNNQTVSNYYFNNLNKDITKPNKNQYINITLYD